MPALQPGAFDSSRLGVTMPTLSVILLCLFAFALVPFVYPRLKRVKGAVTLALQLLHLPITGK